MTDEYPRSRSVGLPELVLGVVVLLIGAYAVLTANLLLGALVAATVLLGYAIIRLLVEFVRLLRRMVVALERISENS